MDQYTKAAADASAAIRENGGPVTIYRSGTGINPVSGTVGEPTLLDDDAYAILTKYSRQPTSDGQVKVGDKAMLLDTSATLKEEDYVVTPDGVRWNIKSLDEVNPSGMVRVLAKVQVRR